MREGHDTWTPYAIELNLRKGGTTHPFLTLQFLTDGAYDPDTALFIAPSGREKHLVATDHLHDDLLRGLTIDDLFDIAVRHRLHFDQARQTGVVFHMMGALAELGSVGLTAVGDSRDQADADVPPRRARAARRGGSGARAAAPGALTARVARRARVDRHDPAGRRGDPARGASRRPALRARGPAGGDRRDRRRHRARADAAGRAAGRSVERAFPARRAGRAAADRPARARAVHVRRRLGPRPAAGAPARGRRGRRLDRVDAAAVRPRARRSRVYLHPDHDTVAGEPVPFWPFALFVGASLALTAFPVLARILGEFGLAATPLGALDAHRRGRRRPDRLVACSPWRSPCSPRAARGTTCASRSRARCSSCSSWSRCGRCCTACCATRHRGARRSYCQRRSPARTRPRRSASTRCSAHSSSAP